jgi:catechol 2,3-dioxygenase-like lactoylglutathione lyase family enzyme
MIEGISHITLVVKDLEKSSEILIKVLGGVMIYDSNGITHSIAEERFFDINGLWLVLMQGSALPEKSYSHFAFKVSETDLPHLEKEINALGLEVKPSRSRKPSEGTSIYFYDYDNHLFELHTGTLQERLDFYNRAEK